jgi:hypothetical protein
MHITYPSEIYRHSKIGEKSPYKVFRVSRKVVKILTIPTQDTDRRKPLKSQLVSVGYVLVNQRPKKYLEESEKYNYFLPVRKGLRLTVEMSLLRFEIV